MPYVINRPPAKRARALARRGALVGVLAAVATSLAASPAMADTSSCSDPTLVQPFLSWNDSNWYTLAPGESADNFDGTGWILNGGASLVSTTLADGSTGDVLDLPAGSSAVSPPMCVASNYPTARMMVQQAGGWGGVRFAVSYQDPSTGNWSDPETTGWVSGGWNGWTLSNPVDIQPGDDPGWQLVQFTLTATSRGSNDSQLYNFYVDPYAKG